MPLTAAIFTIASLAGLVPPKFVPSIFNLSPAAYPDVASGAVPAEVNDVIAPAALTPVTVTVKSLVLVTPPNVVPSNTIVLPTP